MQSSTESQKGPSQGGAAEPAVAATESTEARDGHEARLRQVEGIVRRNVYWALGIGIIPFPIVDIVGLVGVELKMIKELSDVYGVKFTENTAKSIVTSLAVSVGSVGIAELIGGSLLKVIPAIGQIVGVVGVSVVSAAFTQALGSVFIMHFEAGGTLLSFKPDTMRDFFRKEFEKAKATVSNLRAETSEKEAARKPA